MPNPNGIVIRTVISSDTEKLIEFFVEAYGKQTLFQSRQFLEYYFGSRENKFRPFSNNLVGINSDGKIVSHYGGLYYEINLMDAIVPVVWGVNAFTLPAWRGRGINSQIVDHIQKNNVANAVIGMPLSAPNFYKEMGYNIFNKEPLSRFVYNLHDSTFDVVKQIGQDETQAKKLLSPNPRPTLSDSKHLIELTKQNFNTFQIDFAKNKLVTTHRDADFIDWRIFKNPFVTYSVFGYVKDQSILAYMVLREEILKPTKHVVNRIIDLFGDPIGIKSLLDFAVQRSFAKKHIYIDFSKFGNLYDDELLNTGFIKLENENCSLLPHVTSPIENRPNHEFIVLQSSQHNEKIQQLTKNDVYFTRIDGDRDRIARIDQIPKG